jgi:hypothetical protein
VDGPAVTAVGVDAGAVGVDGPAVTAVGVDAGAVGVDGPAVTAVGVDAGAVGVDGPAVTDPVVVTPAKTKRKFVTWRTRLEQAKEPPTKPPIRRLGFG